MSVSYAMFAESDALELFYVAQSLQANDNREVTIAIYHSVSLIKMKGSRNCRFKKTSCN